MDITISLITTLVLTLINGYFSMSEMALTTAKRAVLEHEAEEGDKRAERAIKLAADSDQLLATIQVAITLVGFASSAVASTTERRSTSVTPAGTQTTTRGRAKLNRPMTRRR